MNEIRSGQRLFAKYIDLACCNAAKNNFLYVVRTRLQQQKSFIFYVVAGQKFRSGGMAKIIFSFFKKNPKVFQPAADSLNKGNC